MGREKRAGLAAAVINFDYSSGGAVAQLGARPGETGKVGSLGAVACCSGGAVAQLGARLDGIEEVVGSNPIGSTKSHFLFSTTYHNFLRGTKPLSRRAHDRIPSIYAVGDCFITVGIDRKDVREAGDLEDLVDMVV